jgi:hypothetical protein
VKRSAPLARKKPLKNSGPLKRRYPLKPRSLKNARDLELDYCKRLCRQVVLLRDGMRCRMDGKGPDDGRILQAAHILPTGKYPSMRFVLENIITLCAYPCHLGTGGWHNSPLAALAWAEQTLGADHLAKLRLLAEQRKGQRLDLKLERLYLERELSRYERRAAS